MSYPTINLKLDLLIKQLRAGLRAETEAERLQAEETFKRAVGELYVSAPPTPASDGELAKLVAWIQTADYNERELRQAIALYADKPQSVTDSSKTYSTGNSQPPVADISLCQSCHCMTHTIDGRCGKCGANKAVTGEGDDYLTFIINELVGYVKHTYSFDDEPTKKARQLEGNVKAIAKAKQAIRTRFRSVEEIEAAIPKKETESPNSRATLGFNRAIDMMRRNLKLEEGK